MKSLLLLLVFVFIAIVYSSDNNNEDDIPVPRTSDPEGHNRPKSPLNAYGKPPIELIQQLTGQLNNKYTEGVVKGVPHDGPGSASNPLLFKRIFIMYFENHGYLQALYSPKWQPIIKSSAWLTNFHATTHPSQPNYIATFSGSTLGCNSDNYFSTDQETLIDLLENAGVTWKSYQEQYTPAENGNCDNSQTLNEKLYWRKHNPMMSFERVRNSLTRCQNIVNSAQLDIDIANNNLPQVSFYTPNINNDAHDTDMTYAGDYLQNWLPSRLNNPNFIDNTLFFLTFDEDEFLEFQHIPAMMWGPTYVQSGVSISAEFNHYSLLKMVEENFGLGNLGRNDVDAYSMMNIWRPGTGGQKLMHSNGKDEIWGNAGVLLHNLKVLEKLNEEQRNKVLDSVGNELLPMDIKTRDKLANAIKDNILIEKIINDEQNNDEIPQETTTGGSYISPEHNTQNYKLFLQSLIELRATKDLLAQNARLTLARLTPLFFPDCEPLDEEELDVHPGAELMAISDAKQGFQLALQVLINSKEQNTRNTAMKLERVMLELYPESH